MVLPIPGVSLAVGAINWLWSWFSQPAEQENPTMREAKRRAAEAEEQRMAKERQEEAERERDRYAEKLETLRKKLVKLEQETKEQKTKEQETKEQETKEQEMKAREEKKREAKKREARERKRKRKAEKQSGERMRKEQEKMEQEMELEEKRLEERERKERQRVQRVRKEQEKMEQEKERKRKEEKQRGETKPVDSKKAEKETDTPSPESEVTTGLQYDLILQLQELKDCEAQLRAKEAELLEQTRLAHESARTARQQHESGRQPTKWPTAEELQRGRDLVQYNVNNVHFAIVGKSGSGKSSLINAFLNLSARQPGAAATGVTETTATIARYPDPGREPPRPWTVWYDVPGAGTQNVSAREYFINQGLFVFDVILIAIGDRFEETDVQLLKDCHRFKIPALIVRSKADMHIDNLVKEDGGWGQPVDQDLYRRCRDTFVTESKQMVRNELAKAQLDDQEVYLVSSYTLRTVYNRSLNGREDGLPPNLLDEQALIRDLMIRTVQRRCGDSRGFQAALELVTQGNRLINGAAQVGRAIHTTIQTATGRLRNAVLPDRALPHEHVVAPEAPPDNREVQPEQDTRSTRSRPPTPTNRAVLNCLPGQVLPDEVELFGHMLTLQPYREPNTNPRREQPRPPATHSQTPRTSGDDKPVQPAKRNSGYRSPTVEEVEDEAWQFLDDLC